MSDVDLTQLDELSRDDLIGRAAALGVTRAELLTRVELRDEIVRLTETDELKRQRARGWFGVARDLVASVVEQRLNLPDAADLIRGVNVRSPLTVPPVATVTLAEIYAAQGHVKRALKMLDEVLEREPDHAAAREARENLMAQAEAERAPQPSEPPEALDEFEEPAVSESADARDACTTESSDSAVVESGAEAAHGQSRNLPSEAGAATPIDPGNVPSQIPGDGNIDDNCGELVTRHEADIVNDRDFLMYRRSSASVVCHWSITSRTWDGGSKLGGGQWVLRVVQIMPVMGPLVPVETLVPLPGTSGEAVLNDVAPRQQIRMAIGWDGGGRFVPAAIGVEVAGTDEHDVELAWLPLPGLDEPAPAVWLDCARRSWRYLDIGRQP